LKIVEELEGGGRVGGEGTGRRLVWRGWGTEYCWVEGGRGWEVGRKVEEEVDRPAPSKGSRNKIQKNHTITLT